MLFVCAATQAQTIGIKPYFRYHQPVSSQDEPVFYVMYLDTPPMAGNNIFIPSSYNEDFTLAKGIEYGLTVNYTFRNQLGFELGLGYFSGLNKHFKATEIYAYPIILCSVII